MNIDATSSPGTALPLSSDGIVIQEELVRLLERLRTAWGRESKQWSRRSKLWGSASVVLAIISALGSGAAGATVAAISDLTTLERTLVIILAFVGASLSGIAAAVGAPIQFKTASRRTDGLAALENWIDLVVIEIPTLSIELAQDRVREILAWRDEVFGVDTPSTLLPTSAAPAGTSAITPPEKA